jgi:hypothetical protein
MGVREKCCTPLFLSFIAAQGPCTRKHRGLCALHQKMSEPGTSYRKLWPKDLTGHRYGVSLRSIPTRELEAKVKPVGGLRGFQSVGEKERRREALAESAIEAERQFIMSYRKKGV